jgi:antitoxin (DNA-binding transcriptional repressor) of toxin-antitoxin stability system
MKSLTRRDLNRHKASALDALESGESFALCRKGRAAGNLTKLESAPKGKPDWKAHFAWLKRKSTKNDAKVLKEFEDSRRRLAARGKAMGALS